MRNKKRLLILIGIYIIVFVFVVLFFITNLIEKTAITSFKKLYNAYSQALLTTVDDFEGETGCYFSIDKSVPSNFLGCDKFYKKYATNLNVTKYCKVNSLADGCLPVYNTYIATPSCAGFSESMMNRFNSTFVMRDNTTLTVFNQPTTVKKPLFAVDSNGKLFPNKSGYDQFSFVIIRNSNGHYYFHPNITYCLPFEQGGIHNLQDVYK